MDLTTRHVTVGLRFRTKTNRYASLHPFAGVSLSHDACKYKVIHTFIFNMITHINILLLLKINLIMFLPKLSR